MNWGKQGMEMWQLVIIILAILLLLFILAWYSSLGSELQSLLERMGDFF